MCIGKSQSLIYFDDYIRNKFFVLLMLMIALHCSFGVICWEMWSLSDPTQNKPAEMYASEVAIHNKRPPFDVVFNKRTQSMIQFQVPEKWKYLIENCWAADPARRPSFEQIIQFLDAHLKA